MSTGIGTFQTYYETTLLNGYSTSTIAWIPSLEVFFMFFMVRSSLFLLSRAKKSLGLIILGPYRRHAER